MEKEFDIILLGATGFTGQLISEYLSKHAKSENISWAIAGRDNQKLIQVKDGLSASKPIIEIVDIDDNIAMRKLTSKCKILMNAVGPFNWYGKKVVSSCIETHTHYLDITGEPSFVADIYNNFSDLATQNEICVVNCCGFDSIPADYAAYLTVQKLPVEEPKALWGFIQTNATFSGGTMTTAIEALYMESKKKSNKIKIKKHPNAPKLPIKIHYNNDVESWAIPMPVVDPHIVKRTAWKLENVYGSAFSYGQFFIRSSFVKVLKTVLPIVFVMFLVRIKFFRKRLFDKFKSGTGPNEQRRNKSKFKVICIGKTANKQVITTFSGGDPGYNETAKMFSQAAFTLLDRLKNRNANYGVLTPVQAFGMYLIDRLKKVGIKIE